MKKVFLTLAFVLSAVLTTGCWSTGDGEKVGVFTKIAKQGAFCQTWEGTLVRGGLTAGSGVTSTPFNFTVEDEALVEVIREAMEKGTEVKIRYNTELATFCRADSDNVFVTIVTPLAR